MGNYYGILPSFIRYDRDLPPAAKVLYAEITSQINFKGIYSESNDTLANLYGVTPQTISSWLKTLKNKGYIFIHYPGGENSEVQMRQIVLPEGYDFFDPPLRKSLTPLKKNLKENIEGVYNDIEYIYNNNIYNDIKQDIINDRIYNDTLINDIVLQNHKISITSKLKNSETPEPKYSELAVKSYDHFVALFPKKMQPKTEAQKNKWLDCLDKLERLDGYSLQVVYFISKKARSDQFWETNFLSVLKLRQTNKQGVKYVDVFKERFAKELPDKLKS
jgi:hypothetical protein